MTTQDSSTLYDRLGGEDGVHRLVGTFYRIMNDRPEAAGIRALHPQTLEGSQKKLFMYFSGWFGGPPLFTDAFGHPRVRSRHLPFSIGEGERDQWLFCLASTFKELELDPQLAQDLWDKIAPMAVFLCSDAARDVTGQIFAVRNNEIFLMSQHRPLRSMHRDGWTAETIAEHAMPAFKADLYALDRSQDIWPWDPG